jgi:hypothetical protein
MESLRHLSNEEMVEELKKENIIPEDMVKPFIIHLNQIFPTMSKRPREIQKKKFENAKNKDKET